MTAFSVPAGRLLTVADYLALPETDERFELQGGSLVMSPSPKPRHQKCMVRLIERLGPQLPPDLDLIAAVDVDLQLGPTDAPGSVRAPDAVVATLDSVQRVEREGGILRAADVVLAVEILSPGSARIDRTLKRAEYADAGIPHYWLVDISDRPSLVACHLAGEFGYADAAPATGVFETDAPFPLRLDLDQLASW